MLEENSMKAMIQSDILNHTNFLQVERVRLSSSQTENSWGIRPEVWQYLIF